MRPWQKLKQMLLIHLPAALASIVCLLFTCLPLFWTNNLYAFSLSEYFRKKVEEKKIQKEEAAAAPLSCAPSAVALSGKKKAAKPGFSLFPFNIFCKTCNTDIDKDAKILLWTLKSSVTCSGVQLLCPKSSFCSQQFLLQEWDDRKKQFSHHSLAFVEQSFCLCFTVVLDRRLLLFRVRNKNGGGCKWRIKMKMIRKEKNHRTEKENGNRMKIEVEKNGKGKGGRESCG